MPFKNKEDKKQHNKQYYLDNEPCIVVCGYCNIHILK